MRAELLVLSASLFVVYGLENGLARTPPMGWMSWTRFYCEVDCEKYPFSCINENLYKWHGERLVLDGYAKVGYDRIHIDDCWAEKERDANHRLVADKKRFPSGIPALADYLHNLGLKFGSYLDYGNYTCGGYPGTKGFEKTDSFTFAEWGVDYLKLDGCYAVDEEDFETGYSLVGKYLNQSGRQIVYSCSWPAYIDNKTSIDYVRIAKLCNLWRNYQDIASSWDSLWGIITAYVSAQDQLIPVHGPGHWNDPDMLIVGNPGVSLGAARVQMAVWAIWSAPLIMSNDLRIIPPEHAALLKNEKVIAIDQDPLGLMGRMVKNTSSLYYFIKPITPYVKKQKPLYSYAVAVVNYSDKPQVASFTLQNLGIKYHEGYQVYDIFEDKPLGAISPSKAFHFKIPPQDAVFLRAIIDPTADELTQ